jgi:hypothetical protein
VPTTREEPHVTATPTQLEAQIAGLRAELAQLRNGLATELVTRRVSIVGPDGFERIQLHAGVDWAEVGVYGRAPDGTLDPACVWIHAGEENEAPARDAGITIIHRPGDPGDDL